VVFSGHGSFSSFTSYGRHLDHDQLRLAGMRQCSIPHFPAGKGRSGADTDGVRGLLIQPTEEDWRAAWQAYRRGEADQAGIVDHVSFVVMRRLKIPQAFTNDNHFRAAGFETLFD